MSIVKLRQAYHRRICTEIVRLSKDGDSEYPNFADKGSKASRAIALTMVRQMDCPANYRRISGQTAGGLFEVVTKDFLEATFSLVYHLRPGRWYYSTQTPISDFDQYMHLANLEQVVKRDSELAAALGGDYIITPDIVIGRHPVPDEQVNQNTVIVGPKDAVAVLTPLREVNFEHPHPILHASISCKWTLRSDRSQNAHAEALNLIRNRKGNQPHIVAVTAEPLPTRIASLALGTGDLDCVYHFALYELQAAIAQIDNEDQMDMLNILVEGRRLRDISDLPFDLAI